MTESLAGRKERPRRVGETEKEGRKEERREEKGEDEGDGKSKGEASNRVGRNDRLGCGREEMERGSGEEDKRWEVTKTRVAFWIKKYSFC